ncbi:MAG: cytochrome c [Woeseiaceae bacterium]|nr:cytochrome c [Woeseiaceae bacterium]
MSMHKARCLAAIAALAWGPAAADDAPALGEPLAAEEIAAVSFTILPDGSGLPPGSGSVADGEAVYAQHCLACHGAGGEGGPNDRLAGGRGSLDSAAPVKTVGSYWPYATTLFDYLRRAMPYTAPGTLSADELYAVTAYVLHLNGIVGADAVLDAERLPAIEMPNRNGFERAWPDQ